MHLQINRKVILIAFLLLTCYCFIFVNDNDPVGWTNDPVGWINDPVGWIVDVPFVRTFLDWGASSSSSSSKNCTIHNADPFDPAYEKYFMYE